MACEDRCEYLCQTSCEAQCKTGCELDCKTGCEVNCETSCEESCQESCKRSCQTKCESSCMTTCEQEHQVCRTKCEVSCQGGCEASCKTGCEVNCKSSCESSCQETCESTCETSCQESCKASCQSKCEASCMTACEQENQVCETKCEVACQGGCEASCKAGCERSCKEGCEVACKEGCEGLCQTKCEVDCKTTCEISCQEACQTSCKEAIETGCDTACELTCKVGCEVSCQDTCQISCQEPVSQVGCTTTCQTSCQEPVSQIGGCEIHCQNCEGACQTNCEIVYQTTQYPDAPGTSERQYAEDILSRYQVPSQLQTKTKGILDIAYDVPVQGYMLMAEDLGEAALKAKEEGKHLEGLLLAELSTAAYAGAGAIMGGTGAFSPLAWKQAAEGLIGLALEPGKAKLIIGAIKEDPRIIAQIAGAIAGGLAAEKAVVSVVKRLGWTEGQPGGTYLKSKDGELTLETWRKGKPGDIELRRLEDIEVNVESIRTTYTLGATGRRVPGKGIFLEEIDDLMRGVGDDIEAAVVESVDDMSRMGKMKVPGEAVDDVLTKGSSLEQRLRSLKNRLKRLLGQGDETQKTETYTVEAVKEGVPEFEDIKVGTDVEYTAREVSSKYIAEQQTGPTIKPSKATKAILSQHELETLSGRETMEFGGEWFEEGIVKDLEKGTHSFDVKGAVSKAVKQVDELDDVKPYDYYPPESGPKTPWVTDTPKTFPVGSRIGSTGLPKVEDVVDDVTKTVDDITGTAGGVVDDVTKAVSDEATKALMDEITKGVKPVVATKELGHGLSGQSVAGLSGAASIVEKTGETKQPKTVKKVKPESVHGEAEEYMDLKGRPAEGVHGEAAEYLDLKPSKIRTPPEIRTVELVEPELGHPTVEMPAIGMGLKEDVKPVTKTGLIQDVVEEVQEKTKLCITGCKAMCQGGCQIQCQESCKTSVQEIIEPCKVGCEVQCQVGCKATVQTCPTGCEVHCMESCKMSVQDITDLCTTGCEALCQTGCKVLKQVVTPCKTGCKVLCQTGCKLSVQTVEEPVVIEETEEKPVITTTLIDKVEPVTKTASIDKMMPTPVPQCFTSCEVSCQTSGKTPTVVPVWPGQVGGGGGARRDLFGYEKKRYPIKTPEEILKASVGVKRRTKKTVKPVAPKIELPKLVLGTAGKKKKKKTKTGLPKIEIPKQPEISLPKIEIGGLIKPKKKRKKRR